MIAESKLFIKLWLRSPLTMGALMPSSRGLAEAIARQVPKGKGPVIELGGGTGAVTEALLDAGVKREDLFVIELDDELHAVLTKRFAGVRVIKGDATQLRKLLKPYRLPPARAVVSGLPLLSMRRPVQEAILDEAFAMLPPGGDFIQSAGHHRRQLSAGPGLGLPAPRPPRRPSERQGREQGERQRQRPRQGAGIGTPAPRPLASLKGVGRRIGPSDDRADRDRRLQLCGLDCAGGWGIGGWSELATGIGVCWPCAAVWFMPQASAGSASAIRPMARITVRMSRPPLPRKTPLSGSFRPTLLPVKRGVPLSRKVA